MKFYIAVLTIILLISCNHKAKKEKKYTSDIAISAKTDNIPTIDTTIILTDIIKSDYYRHNLTDSIAKKTLYNYFEDKGYYNSDNLPDLGKLTDADNNKLSVSYHKMFLLNLNGNQNQDAIITYWLTPPYASGHCWQPHKAIILDTGNGYKITNEEFIPDFFAIDSVLNKSDQITIYGYGYDCKNHKVLKYIRARLIATK